MKIEKLAENKIRIILKKEDFKDKTIDIKKLLLTTPESQDLFLEILILITPFIVTEELLV